MTLHASHNIVTPTDIVIPTGDSLSSMERDAEWRDPVFALIFVGCL